MPVNKQALLEKNERDILNCVVGLIKDGEYSAAHPYNEIPVYNSNILQGICDGLGLGAKFSDHVFSANMWDSWQIHAKAYNNMWLMSQDEFWTGIFRLEDTHLLESSTWHKVLNILCVFLAPLPALYGLMNDGVELVGELVNKQRVMANTGTLVLTAGYCVGATFAALAIFATNPVGWAGLAGLALVAGVALLVKMTRILLNAIDARKDDKSMLATDSRFQLTKAEEDKLTNMNFDENQIKNFKTVIQGLAILAHEKRQYGLFGSKNNYLHIIEMLNEVKSGSIPKKLAFDYGFLPDGKEMVSNEPNKQWDEVGAGFSTAAFSYSYPAL